MKSKEELNALKEKVETVSRKLEELTDEELEQVFGARTDISIVRNGAIVSDFCFLS